MINQCWKIHDNLISLSKGISNSNQPSLAWKLMEICVVGFRDCKYPKNDNWQKKQEVIQIPFK